MLGENLLSRASSRTEIHYFHMISHMSINVQLDVDVAFCIHPLQTVARYLREKDRTHHVVFLLLHISLFLYNLQLAPL